MTDKSAAAEAAASPGLAKVLEELGLSKFLSPLESIGYKTECDLAKLTTDTSHVECARSTGMPLKDCKRLSKWARKRIFRESSGKGAAAEELSNSLKSIPSVASVGGDDTGWAADEGIGGYTLPSKPFTPIVVSSSGRAAGDCHDSGMFGLILEKPEVVPAPDFGKIFFRKRVTPPSALATSYLDLCLQLVRAEYGLFFKKAVAEAPSPGWRNRTCHVHWVEAERISDGHRSMQGEVVQPGMYNVAVKRAWDCRRGGAEVPNIAELKGHLVIWRENLFITYVTKLSCGCKTAALFSFLICNTGVASLCVVHL